MQITADGHWLWIADAHANSISRIDTTAGQSQSFQTSNEAEGDNLKGLSVMEDGSAVWAAGLITGCSGDRTRRVFCGCT